MPFIGNSVQNQGFAPAVDYFNGDGTTVTFTLSRPVASVAQLTAVIENVIQNPGTAFTVSGNQITFTSAPPSGTGNIWVEYTSLITQYNGISENPSVVGDLTMSGGLYARGDFGSAYDDGTVVDYVTGAGRITVGELDDLSFYHGGYYTREEMLRLSYQGNHKFFGTGALTIPVGTTAQRPVTPEVGMQRYNTTSNAVEVYTGTQWQAVGDQSTIYTANFLVIAGGGGGGSATTSSYRAAGGGGGGGYRTSYGTSGGGAAAESALTLTRGTVYTATVGAGGSGAVLPATGSSNGSNSVFGSITSIGGGRGNSGDNGASGGSGGGGSGSTGFTSGGAGTTGQGYAGGNGESASSYYGGGGGGAGGAGSAQNGGAAQTSTISGSSIGYAGGGGGGGNPLASNGTGGTAAGNGGTPGGNGTTNRGGGGGGGRGDANSNGGNGGSGVVVIRVPTVNYSGVTTGSPTITTSGSETIITFTSSGTYTA